MMVMPFLQMISHLFTVAGKPLPATGDDYKEARRISAESDALIESFSRGEIDEKYFKEEREVLVAQMKLLSAKVGISNDAQMAQAFNDLLLMNGANSRRWAI